MSIDKKFPWSFSGFIIGIIALIVSLIIFYYSESKEKFDFKLVVDNEFNLIELKDELWLFRSMGASHFGVWVPL